MGKILVTGLTGNVGKEVALKLKEKNADFVSGVRNIDKVSKTFGNQFEYVNLDFNDPNTYLSALEGINRIFLVFPPQTELSNFHSFIEVAKKQGITHIVYLSVKDVQYMPFIPHYKNEKKIKKLGIPYTFIRAGYFMHNLNMFLLDEIKKNDRIFITAGKGKTSFIDIRDIAEVAALSLIEGDKHKNKKYALTGQEALDFYEVADKMSDILHRNITYSNPTGKGFKEYMLSKGLKEDYIELVSRIHFFTKIGLAKGITNDFEKITGNKPTKIDRFISDYKDIWS